MNTANLPMYEWKTLPWQQYERQVFKLQKRIYQATRRGDVKAVHRLQRLLMKSWAAKCLAVRRVTQDNRGKRTAGVDGVKSLNPKQRLQLAQQLDVTQQAKPTRRVWIPKPGKTEKRPLGIPTLQNRAEQSLAKLALEPEWEAKFEPNSYGFRPGRSCHDAIGAIFTTIVHKPKYVLDADIAKCFDNISHSALLKKLNTSPRLHRAIKAWLTAGVMEGEELFPTPAGTPQGGTISPLLANVALHGLEERIAEKFPKAKVIRYADDLAILHPDLTAIEEIQRAVSEWLVGMGLELKPSKTRITHTLVQHQGEIGFDFLGFNIRQHRVGQTHSGKKPSNKQSLSRGFKTIITPSEEACHRHSAALRTIIRGQPFTTQEQLIGQLNPVIRGWTNYHSTCVSKATFSKQEYLLFRKLYRWAVRRHPNQSRKRIVQKYWHPQGKRQWNFGCRKGRPLYRHSQTPIKRHIKVQGGRSPYDGDWVYWASRLGRHPELPKRVSLLLRKQEAKCACCGLYFTTEDVLEVDHIIPISSQGKDETKNWQLLHRHCHHCKTANDKRSAHDKSQTIEEPDAWKQARPVLKPSGGGDPGA